MTTLQGLIDASEADLGDSANSIWSAADIEQWCRDAIGDYGQHFRVRQRLTVALSANDHDYTLAADDFLDVIAVEYPSGQDPPRFLRRRYFLREDFFDRDGFFDVEPNRDESVGGPTLYLSANPAAGQSAVVIYEARPEPPSATSGTIPVPKDHEHILRLFVAWRARLQLQAAEEASPTSNSSLLMSQLAQNADRARRAYVDALSKAYFAQSQSRIVRWRDLADEAGQIY